MDLVSGDALLEAVSMNSAASHFDNGILLRSNTVLTVTVNCSRQPLHW
jgi:hypothetical protein